MMCRWMQNCRILLPLFLVSAALNIMFAGYHLGHSFFKMKPSHQHVMNARIEGLTSLLPSDSRAEMEDVLNKKNDTVKTKYKAMNAERHRIQKIIASRDVNKDDLHASFDHLRQLHADSQKIYQDAFTDAVAKLSYSDRRQINLKIKQRHPLDGTNAAKGNTDEENPSLTEAKE